MTERTTTRRVTFRQPFKFSGMDAVQPAGTYVVETDEELLDVSFTAYRRVATFLVLPSPRGSAVMSQTVKVDPVELEAALSRP